MIAFYSQQGSKELREDGTVDPESYDVARGGSLGSGIIRVVFRPVTDLTETMELALRYAAKHGSVLAGIVDDGNRRHMPKTLRALARLGLLSLYVDEHGACAGRLTVAGRNHVTAMGYIVREAP